MINIELNNKIKEIIKTSAKPSSSLKKLEKDIIKKTLHLTNQNIKLTERTYCLINNINIPICPICLKSFKFVSINNGYETVCKVNCEKKRTDNIKTLKELEDIIKDSNNIKFSTSLITKNGLLSTLIDNTKFLKDNVSISERIFNIQKKLTNISTCSFCKKKEVKYINITEGYHKFCSNSCSYKATENQRKETNLEKYGVKNTFLTDKSISNKEKNLNNKKEEITNKIKESKKKNFNGQYNEYFKKSVKQKWSEKSQSEKSNITKKIKTTKKEKYGDENFSNKEKASETRKLNTFINNIKILNIEPMFEIKDYTGVEDIKYKWKCNICKTIYDKSIDNGNIPICPVCNKNNGTSNSEIEIYNYIIKLLQDNNKQIDKCIGNDKKVINPLELNIYCKDNNIGFEFNGLYYHSKDYLEENKKESVFLKSKMKEFNLKGSIGENYHLIKTKLLNEKNISLFHIREDNWINPIKKNIIKSMIKYKLKLITNKVYARNCYIKEIDSETSNFFLESHHLQGKDNAKVRIGLFDKKNNQLLSLMTFGNSRYDKDYDYELWRFCSKKDLVVVGGAEKLLKYFIKEYNPISIMTYANRDYSNNPFYNKLGFTLIGETKPNFKYFKQQKTFSREKFQKHKLKALKQKGIINIFEDNLSAEDNMKLNKFNKIYDCGNYKFHMLL